MTVSIFTLLVSEMQREEQKEKENLSVFLLILGTGKEEIAIQKQEAESARETSMRGIQVNLKGSI